LHFEAFVLQFGCAASSNIRATCDVNVSLHL